MSANSGMQPTPSEANDRPETRGPADDEAQQWADWLRQTAIDGELWTEDHATAQPEGDGATLLDLVAAVEYLARGHRAGFTVWDAIEEALRWWTDEHDMLHHGAPDPDDWTNADPVRGFDPLGHTLHRFAHVLASSDAPPAPVPLEQALRHWTAAMADRYNDSHHWPHPSPRRSFPPVQT